MTFSASSFRRKRFSAARSPFEATSEMASWENGEVAEIPPQKLVEMSREK
jgi:hypothetical protein